MTMRLEAITDRWPWPVYIIGGGPSLKGFDFSRLDGRFKLGCNRSAWDADCDALFSLDQHFMRMARADIIAFRGEKILAVPQNLQNHRQMDDVLYLMHERGSGLSEKPGRVYGVNSGYGALGVAYHKCAPEVYLLGFDFMPGKEATHWHGGYSWHNKSNVRYYDRWASNFERARQQLDERGIRVVNVVGDCGSKVTAFDTMHLDEL
jgi:hypothetical protein